MTIPATSRVSPIYQGNASATNFAFSYKTYAKQELQVIVSDGVTPQTLVLDSDYSVALNLDQVNTPGGTITYPISGSPLPVGKTLVVVSAVPNSQDLSLPTGGAFNASSVELGFDRQEVQLQQFNDTLNRTIRVPVGESISAPLPAALTRANYLLGFDGLGNPVAVAAVNGTAASLAVDLANNTTATKGAGQVGFATAVAYAANTVGSFLKTLLSQAGSASIGFIHSVTGAVQRTVQDALRDNVNIRNFGTLANNGVTDDAAVFQAAAASGAKFIDARGVNCRIGSTINIASGQVWLLEGSKLNFTGSTLTVFSAVTVSDFALIGPFTITGTGTTVGTAVGIAISDCENWYIHRPIMSSIQGWGVYLAPGSSTTSRSRHGTINHPRYDSCYVGQEDVAGTGTEYVQTFGIHATRCTLAGVKTAAGNMKFTGGVVVDNIGNGIMVGAGSNHAHGSFNGLSVNHNGAYGIRCDTILNGELFNDCHIYENPIYINGSVGIIFSGGMLDANVVCDKDANSRPTIFRGMFCPGDYSSVLISGSGTDMLHFDLCHGLGAVNSSRTINDPSLVYVNARRPAGTNQALTSTVAARLIFPTEVFDRRNAHDATTGITTIPVDEWGMYRVSVSAVVSGTALNQTASLVEIRVNGTSKRLCASSISSTTRLTFHFEEDVYLSPADTVEIWANVTGTSPVFGDATYDSALSIEKKA